MKVYIVHILTILVILITSTSCILANILIENSISEENDTIRVRGNTIYDNTVEMMSTQILYLAETPKNGRVTLRNDGYFKYQPNSNYCGIDQFSYTLCDLKTDLCNTETITFLVKNICEGKPDYCDLFDINGLSGNIWIDWDQDEVKSIKEKHSIGNVKVQLRTNNNGLIAETLSGCFGNYLFDLEDHALLNNSTYQLIFYFNDPHDLYHLHQRDLRDGLIIEEVKIGSCYNLPLLMPN